MITLMSNRRGSRLGMILRLARRILFVGLCAWSAMAINYSNIPWEGVRSAAAILFIVASAAVFIFVRPWLRARLVFLGMAAAVIIWFLLIPPSNDRDWMPDVAVLPYAETKGDEITIHNIRNCDYRSETDYTVRHYDKTVNLSKMKSADFYVVTWGSPLIAHTMLSFGFEGGDYICFSIETRKEKGESYSAIRGFFRQYELTYVVADERDLVRLRTDFRGEQVYLYRLKGSLDVAKRVFVSYMQEINSLKDRPEWYNVLTKNCTTNIRGHVMPSDRKGTWNWRMLINGYIDQLGYARGSLDQSLPFQELKAKSLINARAKEAGDSPRFSEKIREGLPGF
jgi:hypothetical protein